MLIPLLYVYFYCHFALPRRLDEESFIARGPDSSRSPFAFLILNKYFAKAFFCSAIFLLLFCEFNKNVDSLFGGKSFSLSFTNDNEIMRRLGRISMAF